MWRTIGASVLTSVVTSGVVAGLVLEGAEKPAATGASVKTVEMATASALRRVGDLEYAVSEIRSSLDSAESDILDVEASVSSLERKVRWLQ